MIQPEEAKRLATHKAPKPAETATVRKEELPASGRELLAQAYGMLVRNEQPGANDALVAMLEQARTDCLGMRDLPKDVPSAAILADKLRVVVRGMAVSGRSSAELYSDVLDLVTDEIRGKRVKRAA